MKKLKITLACLGGVSTKALCSRIVEEGLKNDFEVECNAYSVYEVEEYISGSDVVLVGPQVKFMVKKLQEKFPEANIELIPMADYGQVNGAKIFNDCFKKYNW
ncbi:MAG: hypothetical protein J5365_07175 [Erysipelotrichaceae bacterium]|nr:hypothetical protein [Erysipelotrichaceae bacterium]